MTAMRLGVIGFGIMGERLTRAALDHDPAVVEIAGVWDPSAAAGGRIAAAGVPALDDPAAVIAAADCVYIASPPATHLGHARAAMAAGKAVFTEKPLSVDLEDSRAFAAEVAAGGHRAAVNYIFASSFAVDQLKAWMAEGIVGTPRRLVIETAFKTWPRDWQADAAEWLSRRAEGGFTREVVSHFLFLTQRLIGPMALDQAVVGWAPDDLAEVAIDVELIAAGVKVRLGGGVGSIAQADHNRWQLEGDAGAIRLVDWGIAERLNAEGTWQPPAGVEAHDKTRPLVLKRQIDKLAALTRGAPHDLATVGEALAVQEIVEAILRG